MTKKWTTPQQEMERWGESAEALNPEWCEGEMVKLALKTVRFGSPCGSNEIDLSRAGHRLALLILCASGFATNPIQVDD